MTFKDWSLPTRFLHLGMVLTITVQLFISLIMVAPDHQGGIVGQLAFQIHEIVGMAALAIIIAHWVWSVINRAGGGLNHLFPWFGNARMEVINDGKALLKGKLPEGGNRGGLPGLIHGFGLLAATTVALTGGVLFFIFPHSGEPGYFAELFAETHEGLAALVWAYWLGHGGLAILHHVQGGTVTKKMFKFTKHTGLADDDTRPMHYPKIHAARVIK